MSQSLTFSPIALSGTIPSGSTVSPHYFDVSNWSNVQVSALAWDDIGGTASVYVQSLPQVTLTSGSATLVGPNPYTPFNLLTTVAAPSGTLGTSSAATSSIIPINAKWMSVEFAVTEASSSSTTGSAIVTLTLR